jgi:hypothetical protein
MPEKIAKRSRRVGSQKPSNTPAKKRGRPPKTESVLQPDLIPETISDTTQPLLGSSQSISQSTQTKQQPVEYSAVTQVPHGLTFTTFAPNSYFPTDIFTDSSSLNSISKETADAAIHSIGGKREQMRVILANQGLMQDIIKGGMENRKIEGLSIDYDSLRITNETKFINWQTNGINKNIAINKWQQTNEKLIQGQAVLIGMQAITPLITEEWQARKALKQSSINDLKTKAMKGSSAMDAKLANFIDNMTSNDYED